MNIRIDKEFKALIPPLSGEERDALEQSILSDGCRDAIVLWGDVIVDGHNRYEICTANNIPFETIQKDFADRNDAIVWMIQNQLGRRNIQPYDRALMALKLESVITEQAKKRMISGVSNPVEIFPQGAKKTRDVVGEIAGMSGKQIDKVKKIEAVASPETKQQIRSGVLSISKVFDDILRQAKAAEIEQAKQEIANQTRADANAPVLFVGNSIGFKATEKVDLLLTDPPYSTDVDDIDSFAASWLPTALGNVKDTGFAYVFIGAYPNELKAYLNTQVPPHMKLEQVLVWTYKNTLGNNPKDRYKLNYQACLFFRGMNAPALDCPLTNEQWAVQEINAPDGRQGDRYHAWQKPMEIAERFVRHSTKPGMTVYDPFACTGTFLLAAAKLGRKAYGFELSEENAAIAFDRGCIKGECLDR